MSCSRLVRSFYVNSSLPSLLWPGASLEQDVPLFSADGSMFYTILPAKQGARGEFHHIAGLSSQVAQHIFHYNQEGKQETVCLHRAALLVYCVLLLSYHWSHLFPVVFYPFTEMSLFPNESFNSLILFTMVCPLHFWSYSSPAGQ